MMKFFADRLTPERQRKLIEALAILNVILLVLGGLFAIKLQEITSTNHDLAVEGKAAHDSICALRGDFQRNVDLTRDYLEKHREPVIFGVDREVFVQTLKGRELTLKSLSGLSCTHNQSKSK